MLRKKQHSIRRIRRFFRIALSHDSLENYLRMNFALIHYHKWSLTEIEMMHPWEREIYTALLLQAIEDQNTKSR